jgi:CRISPR/Cas system CMR-associated protein Cmr3 (group 5 of RAMP superfamily)
MHLLGRNDASAWSFANTFLRPSADNVRTDIGHVRLPKSAHNHGGLKPPGITFVNHYGFATILQGKVPKTEDFYDKEVLWSTDSRIGLVRDPETLRTEDNALYSPTYIRLNKDIALGIGVSGIPDGLDLSQGFPLGGESRMAVSISVGSERLQLPPAPDFDMSNGEKIRFILVALSPVPAQENADISSLLGELQGLQLVSACVGRPVYLGGWYKNKPLPLEPFHPAGSVWFFEGGDSDSIQKLHGKHLGDEKLGAYGFGHVAVGAWPL